MSKANRKRKTQILRFIRDNPKCKSPTIAEGCGSGASTTGRLLDYLDKGLVARHGSRGKYEYTVTEEGKKFLNDREWFDEELIKKLYWEKGMSPSEIAEKYESANYTKIYNFMKRRGIKTREYDNQYELWSNEEINYLKEVTKKHSERTWKNIADELNRSVAGVRSKAYKLGLKKGRESMCKDFDRSNTEALSYILGVCYGDGWVIETKRKKYKIGLGTIDVEFAESFKEKLSYIDLNPRLYDASETYQKNPLSKSKKFYTVEAHSKKFYLWYNELDKADLIDFLGNEKSISEFLRGIYESEGSYQEKPRNRLQLSIYNTDLELLKIVREMGKSIDVEFNLYLSGKKSSKRRKDKWILQLSNRREVLTFLNRVKPVISRKTNKS